MVLKLENFTEQVTTFSSAEETLGYLTEDLAVNAPQVIFLDLNMPSMNGWEFLQALKPHENVISSNCSVFILTSSIDSAEQQMAEQHAMVKGFISKPLTETHLGIIKQQLGNAA
ncbi:response regulator receiver domain-containing protein [Pontibacter ummariensis]|uniref:Response regulator receiver domain-containing protein n=2 Tax=Pontibacter ummariensis TaxID=1610492 RepID=A0A239L1G3_9BACT|nr:response regulator receiver domain-containing protein [Pontibacter ummariensis]SNT24281.1 Response regulator receiver domain-containing protein [Pontibacter ummariensis]